MANNSILGRVWEYTPPDNFRTSNDFMILDRSLVSMDKEEYISESYQRAHQYIWHHDSEDNLDNFDFDGTTFKGTQEDSLDLILEYV